jgi:hypothetical protein
MHRVYNSAFMNMMRDEENAKYRQAIKNTLEFDPDILKRYVNFMSNPDERTAIDQFGDGDKYFGVCTLMATLPGLPMFGHGQIEAFTEKYGMEYKRARYDEYPNEGLVERHQREIAPLLRQRSLFAESSDFVLYDFWNESGRVDENVFAYSNWSPTGRAIVIFHNHYGATSGTIHRSTSSMNKATGMLQQKSVGQALHLPSDDEVFLAYQDTITGLEYLTRSTTLNYHGFRIELRAYQYAVLQHWRELRATAECPWDRLHDDLNGAGVHSLDEALRQLLLRPVQDSLRRLLELSAIESLVESVNISDPRADKASHLNGSTLEVRTPDEFLAAFIYQAGVFFDEVLATRVLASEASVSRNVFKERCLARMQAAMRIPSLEDQFAARWPAQARVVIPSHSPGWRAIAIWGPVAAWCVLGSLTESTAQLLAIFDQLRLRRVLFEVCSALGLEGEDSWRAAAGVRLLLALTHTQPAKPGKPLLLDSKQLWNDPDLQWLLGINTSGAHTYFNKELFEEALWWMQLPSFMRLLQVKQIDRQALSEMEAQMSEARQTAAKAGYDVDAFFNLLAPKPPTAPQLSALKPTADPAIIPALKPDPQQPGGISEKDSAKSDQVAKVAEKPDK